jgi:hypothetical protein
VLVVLTVAEARAAPEPRVEPPVVEVAAARGPAAGVVAPRVQMVAVEPQGAVARQVLAEWQGQQVVAALPALEERLAAVVRRARATTPVPTCRPVAALVP